MYGRIMSGPKEQLTPTINGSAWRIELKKAPTVCPLRVRPLGGDPG